MANVRPTVLLSGLPCASFNVPANLIRRGTANVGTTSLGARAVRLGACGSAATGRCCARVPATPQPRENNKHTPTHLMVQFMGAPLSSAVEEIQIFSRVSERRTSTHSGDGPREAGR